MPQSSTCVLRLSLCASAGDFCFSHICTSISIHLPFVNKIIVGVVLLCFVAIIKFDSMPLSFRCLLVVLCCDMKAYVPVLGADVIIAWCLLMLQIAFFYGLSFLISFLSLFTNSVQSYTGIFLANARQVEVREGASFM